MMYRRQLQNYLIEFSSIHDASSWRRDILESLQEGNQWSTDEVGAETIISVMATAVPETEQQQYCLQDVVEGATLDG